MLYQISKRLLLILTFVFLIGNVTVAYAQVDCTLDPDDAPSLEQIVCPLARVINILIYSVGAVFVVMVTVGAIKLAMAVGDPKGFKGAVITWQYMLIGAFIVVGVFAILGIVLRTIGIDLSPNIMTNRLAEYIHATLDGIGVIW